MSGFIAGITVGTIIILIGVIILIYKYLKDKSFKRALKIIGTKAEVAINADIKIWAKHTKNKFLPSTLFKYGENKVFEVDSILLTNKALIVIEIKSIKGGIEGSAADPRWEKVMGESRYYITNPIIQNNKHIDHIINMIKQKVPTISLIIYSNRAQYIKVNNVPSHVIVTKQSELFDILDEINSSLPTSFNEDYMNSLFSNIKSFKATKREDIKLHKDITTKGMGK